MLSSVSTTAALVPVNPRLSVTLATIELLPWFGSVTLTLKEPSDWTVPTPSTVPLSVRVTDRPTTVASADDTVPLMICVAVLLASAALVIVTTGGAGGSVLVTVVVTSVVVIACGGRAGILKITPA